MQLKFSLQLMEVKMLMAMVLCLKFALTLSDQIDIRLEENCITRNGVQGTCKYLDECPSEIDTFANPTKQNIERLNSSLCQSFTPNTISVCCLDESLNTHKTVLEISDRRYCGFQHFDDLMLDIRITSIIEFPWMAALMKKTKDVTDIVCLGALINSKYVVTSGYCAKKHQESPERLWIRLGEFYLKNNTDCVSWARISETECNQFKDYEIDEAVVHPFLSHVILSINDIGLLRLKKTAEFSDYVRPICLPTSTMSSPTNNRDFLTSGWIDDQFKVKMPSVGITSQPCHLSDHKVLFKYNRCIKYQTVNNSTNRSCTFVNNGAPVMFSIKNQWHLEGVSYLFFNLKNECFARYTPIVPYIGWIKDNIRS